MHAHARPRAPLGPGGAHLRSPADLAPPTGGRPPAAGPSGPSPRRCRRRGNARAPHLPPPAAAPPAAAAAGTPGTPVSPGARAPTSVVALGNICVDVIVPFRDIPPVDQVKTPAMLARLAAAAPRPVDGAGDPSADAALELGGNANFLIAAARLGLDPAAAAHVGTDDYGAFASRELGRAGVRLVGPLVEWSGEDGGGGGGKGAANGTANGAANGTTSRRSALVAPYTGDTLVCYVLVDEHAPGGPRHAFCSRYDLGPHPLHVPAGVAAAAAAATAGGASPVTPPPGMPGGSVLMRPRVAPRAAAALAGAATAFVNGFAFDELPAPAVLDALASVRAGGGGGGGAGGGAGSVLFDPGPRAPALAAAGTLDAALSAADVLLLTEEEAAAVTGEVDPAAAARALLARHGRPTGGAVTAVLVKRGPAGAILVTEGDPTTHSRTAPSITARDTVGCGDSFAAAIALARAAGAAPQVMLALANAVGAATALSPGAGRNVAQPNDAAALLRRDAGRDAAAADALKLLAASLAAARARRGAAT